MEQVIDLILAGQWRTLFAVALLPVYAAVVNGLIVRVSKDDVRGPVVPARWRPFLAVGLGILEAGIAMVVAGMTWKRAFASALIAGLLPIAAHQLGIEGLRGGKEVPIPGIMKKGPAVPPLGIIGGVLALVLALFGCTPQKQAAAVTMGEDAAVCALEQYERDPNVTKEQLAIACGRGVLEDLWKVIVARRRVAAKHLGAPPCASSSSSSGSK